MTVLEQRVPEPVLQAQRDPRLRRFNAAAVYAEVWGFLSFDTPKPVKVRSSAHTLIVKPARVRAALDLLVSSGYLRFSHRDGRGIRYYQLVDRRGLIRPPLAPSPADV